MNARFLEEAKEIEARWAKTGLLDGLLRNYHRGQTAVLLESQRLMNEISPGFKNYWLDRKRDKE